MNVLNTDNPLYNIQLNLPARHKMNSSIWEGEFVGGNALNPSRCPKQSIWSNVWPFGNNGPWPSPYG